MKKTSLIASLILAILLQTIPLKANLQSELGQLVNALTNLEMALNQPRPGPRRQETPPAPLPRDVAPQQTCPETPSLRRVQSAYLPKQPLSQSAETPTAKPKPASQPRTTLAQTTPPGGIKTLRRVQSARFDKPFSQAQQEKLITAPMNTTVEIKGIVAEANNIIRSQSKEGAKKLFNRVYNLILKPEERIEEERKVLDEVNNAMKNIFQS